MSTRERGEFTIESDGTTYRLVMDLDAMVALEELYSTPEREVTFSEVLMKVARGGAKHLRSFLWAALRRHHPELPMSAVSAIVQGAGGPLGLNQQLQALVASAAPDKADVRELTAGPSGNPPKARGEKGGTGEGSTSTPA